MAAPEEAQTERELGEEELDRVAGGISAKKSLVESYTIPYAGSG